MATTKTKKQQTPPPATPTPPAPAWLFPAFAQQVEQQYGLPPGILVRTLLPGG